MKDVIDLYENLMHAQKILLKMHLNMRIYTLCCLFICMQIGMQIDAEESSHESSSYDLIAKPFFSKYCTNCHGNNKQKAGLNLQSFGGKVALYKEREMWELVATMLVEREMPPEKKAQPSEEERIQIVQFIYEELAELDCDEMDQTGHVTLRRLNRTEYNYTIRDLIGIDFQPAKDFPLDEVGYGFDNIGDVLSLSPLLMEKYLAAAEQIIDQAIVTSFPIHPPKQKFEAESFRSNNADHIRAEDHVLGFYREGTATKFFTLKESGTFNLTIRAYGEQAGNEPAKLSVRINRRKMNSIEVTAYEDRPELYTLKMVLPANSHRLELGFINNFNADGDRNLFVDYVLLEGPLEKASPPIPETHRRIFTEVFQKDHELESAERILKKFASRAFRRPAKDVEIKGLLKVVGNALEQEASFEEAVGVALRAVLASPSFLYRWELDGNENETTSGLSAYEFASRLSYFLWSSMPDEELFELAKNGTLMHSQILRKQVERMLIDPKSDALSKHFAGQWLQFRNLDSIAPDPDHFPDFDESLRSAMQRESELFFTAMMRENRSLFEFLDADFSFVNARLAAHYDLSGDFKNDFQRVHFDQKSSRGGILTQASILALTANPTRTSPVIRGKWVLEQILGTPPPPPPPEVEELEESAESIASASLRQRLEMHRAQPECATCHAKMDPIGFAFEHFDAIGKWRDFDGNFPIDASGKLPDGRAFEGHKELIEILKNEETFIRTFAEKMLIFALGRGLEYYDRCAVDDIVALVAAADYRFVELVYAIVTSQPFQKTNPSPSPQSL